MLKEIVDKSNVQKEIKNEYMDVLYKVHNEKESKLYAQLKEALNNSDISKQIKDKYIEAISNCYLNHINIEE